MNEGFVPKERWPSLSLKVSEPLRIHSEPHRGGRNRKTLWFWVLRVTDLYVVENVEKPMSKTEFSKEMCTSPIVHTDKYRNKEATINDDVTVKKGETSSAVVTMSVPIADS
ncbi:hypothetical protein PVK06_049152 [Gossypium arboreum]|uniref:Uncharacterized protein n=1 Tax=Gossypium arboreum TaxID=29729 RepID=A0ABR0MI77_GOSAR|nr:hypothetical protein PVK06_049152 [Gossypium arboreum]